MRRYAVLIILLLLAGCAEAAVKTAVPTATVTVVERPLAAATATSIPLTSTETVTRMPPITSQSTGSPTSTPVPYPSPTPLPPLVWTENVVYITIEESLTGPVVWSPIENSFLTTNCRLDITKKWQLLLVSAPDFEKTDITPSNFICDMPVQALAWTPDAQHILFSGSFPKDHPNHPSNFGYDNSAIWIADRTGSESRPVNFDEAYGHYLAYHTLSPKPQLHIFDMSTHEVILSKTSAEPTLHWNGKQFLWSSDGEKLIYRDESENWTFLEVSKDRSTPITLNGGARLSNPQWSFDASYLSVRVTNEQGWETTVLQAP